eukprot:2325235-Pleurochrysis_carterae.AAC.1
MDYDFDPVPVFDDRRILFNTPPPPCEHSAGEHYGVTFTMTSESVFFRLDTTYTVDRFLIS